jgi:hypothetical protein
LIDPRPRWIDPRPFRRLPGSEKEKEIDEKRRGLEAGGTAVEEVDCTGRVLGKVK